MIDLHDEYETMVGSVARSIGRSYLGYTSIPDVEQDLWLWLYEKAEYFQEYTAAPAMAHVALKRRAHVFCEEQRKAIMGADSESLYSLGAVRLLLTDCFDYEDWQSFSQKSDGMPRNKRLEATSDRLAMLIDVKTAVDKLSERNYSIIIAAFKYGYSDEELAEMLGIAVNSVKTTVDRAINALVKVLNPTDVSHEYVATRKVKSNAAARAELDNQW
jgi:RNA polymerase sigma factor (sigma-70 family)